jgi:short-subunit dehydrogenase
MAPMTNFTNQVVIVTGASSGIGAALVKVFSKKGAHVVLVARRRNRLEEVSQECAGESLIVIADLTKEADRKSVIQQTLDRWGRIDILINNAGRGMYGRFAASSETDWRQLFEINLFSAVFLTQDVLPIMQAQAKGLVINMASIGGLIAHSDNVTPYVASKHAMVGFSRGLSRDLVDQGIRVLAVCPHLTDTDFFNVSKGAGEMAPIIVKFKDVMDSPQQVAHGIIEQIDSEKVVLFPTSKPAKAYERMRDI